MELVDTHCHIHFPDYKLDPNEVLNSARKAGVKRVIVVGCSLVDSLLGVDFARRHDGVYSAVGMHPHEAREYVNNHNALQRFQHVVQAEKLKEHGSKLVAIGEVGLDYHYMHSPKEDQQKLLRFQLDIATEFNLPVIFHVREAFEDFWQIYDEYKHLKGVVHSFSSSAEDIKQILKRDLFVGLNGIITFSKDAELQQTIKSLSLRNILLETDAPFLTPTPNRGKVNEPKYVVETANFLSTLLNEPLKSVAATTTDSAIKLFGLN